jgi:hypothetical protein
MFLVLPFDQVNHSILYFLAYSLAFLGIASDYRTGFKHAWLRWYLAFVLWCALVTLVSYNWMISTRQLIAYAAVILIFQSLNHYIGSETDRFKAWFKWLILALASLLLVLLLIDQLPQTWPIIHYIAYLTKDGSRIYLSTVSLCCLVYALYYLEHSVIKWWVIGLSIAANLFYHDGCFWFILVLIAVIYQISRGKLSFGLVAVTSLIIVVAMGLTFVVVTYLLHYNLHLYERLLVFEYWLPKLAYHPVTGVGLGLRQLNAYYVQLYPVDPQMLQANPFVAFHAHNMLIDLALMAGFPGLILFAIVLIKLVTTGFKHNPRLAYGVVSMLVVIVGKNLVDDLFEGSKGMVLMVFVIISYLLTIHAPANPSGNPKNLNQS